MKKVFIILSLLFLSLSPANASETNVGVQIFFCNHNLVCNPENNENNSNCPDDCSLPPSGGGGSSGGIGASSGGNQVTTSSSSTVTTPTSSPSSSLDVSSSTTTASSTENNSQPTGEESGPGSGIYLPNPVFSAVVSDGSILLKWLKTDQSVRWNKVMIRRSSLFYPENILSGGLLYEGVGKSNDGVNFYLYDSKVLNGKRYFYTLFVFDEHGNHSSGVSLSALPVSAKIDQPNLDIPKQELPPETSLPKSPNFQALKLKDLEFFNNPEANFLNIDEVALSINTNTLVVLSKEKLPKEAYSAFLTIIDNNGDYKTYILGVDDKGLSAVLPILNSSEQVLNLTILDKNHQVLSEVKGKINPLYKKELSSFGNHSFFYSFVVFLKYIWQIIFYKIFSFLSFFTK